MLVAGAQTDECTTEDLTEWGASPPDKVIDHTNLYWQNHTPSA